MIVFHLFVHAGKKDKTRQQKGMGKVFVFFYFRMDHRQICDTPRHDIFLVVLHPELYRRFVLYIALIEDNSIRRIEAKTGLQKFAILFFFQQKT